MPRKLSTVTESGPLAGLPCDADSVRILRKLCSSAVNPADGGHIERCVESSVMMSISA